MLLTNNNVFHYDECCLKHVLQIYVSGKKKVVSSGYGKSSRKSSFSVPPKETESKHTNSLLNYIDDLTRSQSYSDVRGSRFKRNVRKVQSTNAIKKFFTDKGKEKHVKHWKLLLQQ